MESNIIIQQISDGSGWSLLYKINNAGKHARLLRNITLGYQFDIAGLGLLEINMVKMLPDGTIDFYCNLV